MLVGLGVVLLVGLLLMVLTVVVLLLLLGVGLLVVVVGRNGKVLLQQNLLAGGGVAVAAAAVVMAAATRAGSVAALAAAAAVCAVGNHLRCASGVCLILQCKITKVVERPGVHYRGRHSPGIFVRWVLPAGSADSFPSLTAVFWSISRFTERNSSFLRLNCSLCSNLHWIFFASNENFSRSHSRTADVDFSSSIFFAWCYQKMHYFCLAAKNDFLALTALALLASILRFS